MKIILTGATGMVGEGVLMECIDNNRITEVLIIGRRHYKLAHPKLKELLVADFNNLAESAAALQGFDACFYCAGISSVGKNEADYSRITYDTTLNFAKVLHNINPTMVFNFVSGAHTNTRGKQMWQRVKGRTEDELMKLGFGAQYNFRPGFMKPFKGQKNVRWFFKPVIAVFPYLFPRQSLTMQQVGLAMINSISTKYHTQLLEIKDIKTLSA